MIVTDDDELASLIRRLRSHRFEERASVVLGAYPPLQASMSDIAAALGLAQLRRSNVLRAASGWSAGIINMSNRSRASRIPMSLRGGSGLLVLYVVHLGTRFSRSTRDSIIDDLYTEKIGAALIRSHCICSAPILISAIGDAISS